MFCNFFRQVCFPFRIAVASGCQQHPTHCIGWFVYTSAVVRMDRLYNRNFVCQPSESVYVDVCVSALFIGRSLQAYQPLFTTQFVNISHFMVCIVFVIHRL